MATHPGSIRRHGRGFEVRLCVAGRRHSYTVRCEDRREAQQWGRHPQKVLDQLIEICGLAADEMLLRLNNAEVRAKLSVDELRLILKEAGAFVLPKKVELGGPAGGPIPIEDVGKRLMQKLGERLARLRVPRPPQSEPAPTAPEREHSPVATAPL